MKYIIIVPDGAADEPIKELGDKTPLEVAHTTNMDFLVQHGQSGLLQTIPEGMPPGSDVGNLALMGYDPKVSLTGRSPLEAANLGIFIDEDEISFRCNMVTIEDNKMLDYSAGHISTEEGAALIKSLNEELGTDAVQFFPGTSYRHIVKVKHRNIDLLKQLKCTPPHNISGQDIQKHLPQGQENELILRLMEHSKRVFENHPVNNVRIDLGENPATMIWLWGQGTKPALDSYQQKYGVDGSIISAVDLVKGIGRLAGLDVLDVPGATGYFDTDYVAKAEYALEALEDKDFVYIHVESPDEAGHLGNIKEKIRGIEQIDREIVGRILNRFDKDDDIRILVAPDHPTPIDKRSHTSDPVPFVLFGKGIHPNEASHFDEISAKEQGLLFKSGKELVDHFFAA